MDARFQKKKERVERQGVTAGRAVNHPHGMTRRRERSAPVSSRCRHPSDDGKREEKTK